MDIYNTVKAAVQTPYHQDLQDAMWHPVGGIFWAAVSVIALIATLFIFKSILHEMRARLSAGRRQWDALMIGRLMWLGGAQLAVFIPLNSAYQPWSLALLVTAGAYMAFLLDSGWCTRRGTVLEKLRAIGRDYRAVWQEKPKPQPVPLNTEHD